MVVFVLWLGSLHTNADWVCRSLALTKPSTLDNTHSPIWKSHATATASMPMTKHDEMSGLAYLQRQPVRSWHCKGPSCVTTTQLNTYREPHV